MAKKNNEGVETSGKAIWFHETFTFICAISNWNEREATIKTCSDIKTFVHINKLLAKCQPLLSKTSRKISEFGCSQSQIEVLKENGGKQNHCRDYQKGIGIIAYSRKCKQKDDIEWRSLTRRFSRRYKGLFLERWVPLINLCFGWFKLTLTKQNKSDNSKEH